MFSDEFVAWFTLPLFLPVRVMFWTENICTITVPSRTQRINKATGFHIARGRINIQRPHSTHAKLNLSQERLSRGCRGSVAPWMPSANQGILIS